MPAAFDASRIPGLAPDKSSLDAGRKLAAESSWMLSASSVDGAYAWGECMGSGSSPYRVCIDVRDGGSKCTCPSRKFPCKHAVGLMFRVAARPQEFTDSPAPDWLTGWVSRRRPSGGVAVSELGQGKPQIPSTAAALAEEAAPDPDQQVRAEAARERNRIAREAAIADGLDGLDQWISDRLERGLASFEATAEADCSLIARRLTDAKAGALAQRVTDMRSRYFAMPRRLRNDFILRELGTLHLLAVAYRRQDSLNPALREDVRRAVGWNVQKADLVADPKALRVRDFWIVAGVTDTAQADGLRRIETWFSRADHGHSETPGFALLQDFVPASSGAQGSPFMQGEHLEAEFAFYASAAPLRAVMTARFEEGRPDAGQGFRHAPHLGAALDIMERAIARQPFGERWPMAAGGVRLSEHGESEFWIVSDGHALPVADGLKADLITLMGMTIDVVGIWDGWRFAPLCAQTPIGTWLGGGS